jgi:hypothetical protein
MSRSKIDCSISIELLQYALNIMVKRIESLNASLEKISELPANSMMNECKLFYNDFQETYDLYLFTYLGHWLRTEHHSKQEIVRCKDLPRYQVLQYESSKKIKPFRDYFWLHCASYLQKL